MPNNAQTAHPHRAFYTVRQIALRHPGFTVRTLRYWIFNSKERAGWKDRRRIPIPGNGFDRAMVRIGRRIYIDEEALFEWIAERRERR